MFEKLLQRFSENDPEWTMIGYANPPRGRRFLRGSTQDGILLPPGSDANRRGVYDFPTEHLMISNDGDAAALTNALRGNTFLKHISIRLCDVLTPSGLVGITAFIAKENSSVRELGICGQFQYANNPATRTTMYRMLLEAARINGKIEVLCVKGDWDSVNLVNCLQGVRSTLKSVFITANAEDIQGPPQLAAFIPTLPQLEKLVIDFPRKEDMESVITLLCRLVGDGQGCKNLKTLKVKLGPDDFESISHHYKDQLGALCDVFSQVLQSAMNLEYFCTPPANPDNQAMVDHLQDHLKKVGKAIKEHTSLRDLKIACGTPELVVTLLESYAGESLENLTVDLPPTNIHVNWYRQIGEVLPQLHLKKLNVSVYPDFGFKVVRKMPLEFINGFRLNTTLTDVHIGWINYDDDEGYDSEELVEVNGCVPLDKAKQAIKIFCLRNKFLPALLKASKPEFLTLLVEMQSNARQHFGRYEEDDIISSDVLSSIYEALCFRKDKGILKLMNG